MVVSCLGCCRVDRRAQEPAPCYISATTTLANALTANVGKSSCLPEVDMSMSVRLAVGVLGPSSVADHTCGICSLTTRLDSGTHQISWILPTFHPFKYPLCRSQLLGDLYAQLHPTIHSQYTISPYQHHHTASPRRPDPDPILSVVVLSCCQPLPIMSASGQNQRDDDYDIISVEEEFDAV